MENQRFDDLSRLMASGASRRTMLRGLVGGALVAVGLRGAATAQAAKVDICHQTGDGTYRKISVSANALDAHLAHGDHYPDTCEEGFEIEPATCECACPITECGLGLTFDPGRCACVCGDRGAIGDECGERGRCLRSVDDDVVCVDTSSGGCDGDRCDSLEDCPAGWLCAYDFQCIDDAFGDFHCVLPV